MHKTITYTIAGFFFFIALFLLNTYIIHELLWFFMSVFAVGIVTCVGLLNNSKTGLTFGLTSILAYLTLPAITDYPGYIDSLKSDPSAFFFSLVPYLIAYILLGLNFAIFGYLPSKYYLKNKKTGSLIKAFIGTSLLSTLLLTVYNAFLTYATYSSYTLNELLLSLPFITFWFISILVWGGICSAICAKWINRKQPTLLNPTPTPLPPSPTPYTPTVKSETIIVRCEKCGADNPINADFCPNCGTRIAEDETRVY